MTIIEALKSGKPFKREVHAAFMIVKDNFLTYPDDTSLINQTDKGYRIMPSDILADDWEVNEEETELKPCPFCGGEAKIEICDDKFSFVWAVCQDCEASSKRCNAGRDAIAAWNRRAIQELTIPEAEIKHLQNCLRDAHHLNSVYKKNVDGLNKRLNEERALIKDNDDAERKAYEAGVDAALVINRKIANELSKTIMPYDEWKRGQS